jgi:hypothetical protein
MLAASQVKAGEVYVPIGIPGLGIGYAYPLNETFALRGDFMTLGQRDRAADHRRPQIHHHRR